MTDEQIAALEPRVVTAALVRTLRERTLAGMADCKRALDERLGIEALAEERLRYKGTSRQGREPLYLRWLELTRQRREREAM